jgi:uncharacterized SAM-binding protein YcdF (DUF218 family)
MDKNSPPLRLFSFAPFRSRSFPAHLDALIVLGARINPQGQPGRVARMRLLHALDLWRTRYPECRIFLSGARRPGTTVSEAVAMARWSCDWAGENWGVLWRKSRDARLVLDKVSHNTAASARNTLRLAQSLQLNAVGLVSDALHLRRAQFLFQRHFARHGITVHPFPVPGVLKHYWRRRRFLWLTRMALREGGAWLKTLGSLPWERKPPG